MIRTEQQAREKIRAVWEAAELFIVLSESQYRAGKSVPRVFQIAPEHMSLSMFTAYDAAAAFCRAEGYLRDGRCLIGRIDNRDPLHDLYSIVNLALFLGVHATDIDCLTEDAVHLALSLLMDWGGKKPQDLSVLMTKEALALAKHTGHFPLKFNEMRLYIPE